MSLKKDLGQFFTTNSDHILQGFEQFIKGKNVLDPFAGGGDLLIWATKNGAASISGLDIDNSLINKTIILNDSLKSIPTAPFIIANPPYLAKNKMLPKQKSEYSMDDYEDFYMLAVKRIIEANPQEGIIILPVNFFSAENSDTIRKEFLTIYKIAQVNYFTNQVFEDTTYNVVAFSFCKKKKQSKKQKINFTFYPNNTSKIFELEEQFNYRIAGKELSKIINIIPLKIIRLTEDHITKNSGASKIIAFFNDKKHIKEYKVNDYLEELISKNTILLNCIDTNGSEDSWINAEDISKLDKDCLVGKVSSRNIAFPLLPNVSLKNQKKIIKKFNGTLNRLRKKYNSLFLTNFRDNDRKRVSFEFCYKLLTYCYEKVKKE